VTSCECSTRQYSALFLSNTAERDAIIMPTTDARYNKRLAPIPTTAGQPPRNSHPRPTISTNQNARCLSTSQLHVSERAPIETSSAECRRPMVDDAPRKWNSPTLLSLMITIPQASVDIVEREQDTYGDDAYWDGSRTNRLIGPSGFQFPDRVSVP
jgi:hypothetical protein